MFEYCGYEGIMMQADAAPYYECYCPEGYYDTDA